MSVIKEKWYSLHLLSFVAVAIFFYPLLRFFDRRYFAAIYCFIWKDEKEKKNKKCMYNKKKGERKDDDDERDEHCLIIVF